MCMVHSPNDRRALFDLIRWLSFRLLLLRCLGVHFCAITLLVSAQSCSAFLHTVTAQFCVVYGTLSRMRLGLEKPLRTRSTSCAFLIRQMRVLCWKGCISNLLTAWKADRSHKCAPVYRSSYSFEKAGIGQILRQWHIGFQVIRNGIHLHFYIRISAKPFESFGFHHCSDDLLPSEDTDWHGR